MAYFKFNPIEWLCSSIVTEKLEVQGLFINICAIFCKHKGVIKYQEIINRFPDKVDMLKTLEGKYFKVNDEYIDILFITDQLNEKQIPWDRETFVYKIRLSNRIDDFVKIGLSFFLDRRYKEYENLGYNVQEISVENFFTRTEAELRESELHDLFKPYQYIPKEKFSGYTECFSLDILTPVITKKTNKKDILIRPELLFPFTSSAFMNAWNELIKQPKWKNKTNSALQSSLKILSEVSEEEAIRSIIKSISGNYQGIFHDTRSIQTVVVKKSKMEQNIEAGNRIDKNLHDYFTEYDKNRSKPV